MDWRDKLIGQIRAKLSNDRFDDEYIGSLFGQICESVIYLDDAERDKAEAMIVKPYTGEVWVESLYNLICGYLHE